MRVLPTLVLALLPMFAFSACRSSDPLAGTWRTNACFGSDETPEDIESCAVILHFTDGLEMSLEAEWVSLPATANLPGCITIKKVTGNTWSTKSESDYSVLHVEGRGAATVERQGCVHPEDDLDKTETSQIAIPSGDIEYQITDELLKIFDSTLEGTYSQ